MSYSKKKLPGWRGAVVRVGRQLMAMAMLSAAGAASAGYVTFDQGAMNAIFSQDPFGSYGIDIRFDAPRSVVAPSLLDIDGTNNSEFSGSGLSLISLSHTLGLPDFTVAMFFVDKISICGPGPAGNIIGCGSNPGGLIALNSDFAAGSKGAVLMAHELGHNLGLSHLSVEGNLMNGLITGGTALTSPQIGSFLDLSAGVSRNPIVQLDGNQFYISIAPIAVLAAAPVPEPQTWAMMLAGLLGVAGWARRRRAWAG